MNKDIFEGKWKQIRGEAKAWWGKLTDDDLDRAAGKFDVFAGLLQEKYGYTRERAAEEIDKRVTEYEARLKRQNCTHHRQMIGVADHNPFRREKGYGSTKAHGLPCNLNIHKGDKNEPSHIPCRCSSDRLGGQ